MICMVNLYSTSCSVICFSYKSILTCVRVSQQHILTFHSSAICCWLVSSQHIQRIECHHIQGSKQSKKNAFLLGLLLCVSNLQPTGLHNVACDYICNLCIYCTIKITQCFRQLRIPVVIFPCMAHELFHNNGHGPLPSKGWTPTS
jgi:hypothetical protein